MHTSIGRCLAAACVTLIAGCSGRAVAQAPARTPPPPARGASPRVSPDGKHVLFGRDSGGRYLPYVMDADGSNERRLNLAGSGTWLPDGQRLLVSARTSRASPGRLTVMNVDGTNPHEIPTGDLDVGMAIPFADGQAMLLGAAVRDSLGRMASLNFFTIRMDGSQIRPVPVPSIPGRFLDLRPSHDGRRLAFLVADTSDPVLAFKATTLYVMNIDGSGLKAVATLPDGLEQPSWSYGDRKIAMQHDDHIPRNVLKRDPNHVFDCNIVVVDVATGAVRQVTHHDRRYLDEVPDWAPDGRIYFQSNRDGPMEIWRMKADGSAPEKITRGGP